MREEDIVVQRFGARGCTVVDRSQALGAVVRDGSRNRLPEAL
jgi:hypothetical protein